MTWVPKTQSGGRKSILAQGTLPKTYREQQKVSWVESTLPKTCPKRHKRAWVPLAWRTNKTGSSFEVDLEGHELTDTTMFEQITAIRDELNFYYPRGTKHEGIACTRLNLSLNRVGDSGIAQLVAFFIEAGICVLSLRLFMNKISDKGAFAICNMIAASPEPMHELHLSHNQITRRGARALFEAIADSDKYPYSNGNRNLPFWLRLEHNSIDWPWVFRNLRTGPEILWDNADKRISPTVLKQCHILMHSSYQNQSLEWAESTVDPDESMQNPMTCVATKSDKNQPTTRSGQDLKWRAKAMPAEQPEVEPAPAEPAQAHENDECTSKAEAPGREQAKVPAIVDMISPEPGHVKTESGCCFVYSRASMLSARLAMTKGSLNAGSGGLHAGLRCVRIEDAQGDVLEAKHTSLIDNSTVCRTVNKIPRTDANPHERDSSDDLRAPEFAPPSPAPAAAAGKWSHVDSHLSPVSPIPRLLGRPPGTWSNFHAPEFMSTKSCQPRSKDEVSYNCAAPKADGEEDECSEEDMYVSRSLQGLASVQLLYQALGAQKLAPR